MTGRPGLDRHTPISTRGSEATHGTLMGISKSEDLALSDTLEALANLLMLDATLRERTIAEAQRVKAQNRKYPTATPECTELHSPAACPTSELATPQESNLLESAWEYLDPTLRASSPDPDYLLRCAQRYHHEVEPIKDFDALDRMEDYYLDEVHKNEIQNASALGARHKTNVIGEVKEVGFNEATAKAQVNRVERKHAKEEERRKRFREERRRKLQPAIETRVISAAATVLPQLHQDGDPQTHRQYEPPTAWATDGGATRLSLKEAERSLRKDPP